jgi:hypothetical protein
LRRHFEDSIVKDDISAWQKNKVSPARHWLFAIAVFFLTSPMGSMVLTAGSREYTKVGLDPTDPPGYLLMRKHVENWLPWPWQATTRTVVMGHSP